MKLLGKTAAITAIVLISNISHGQTGAPVTSAYEGTVGDWALGRWEGYVFLNYHAMPLTPEPRMLIVQRMDDGKIGCLWAIPARLKITRWASKCRITATSVYLLTNSDSDVEMDHTGDTLEGRMLSKGSTRYRAHLKRVQ